jgi:hypothetical protein
MLAPRSSLPDDGVDADGRFDNCLLPLPNLEAKVHHKPFGQIQSHRMTAKKSHNASPMHASCTLQLVIRNSAFNDRASEKIRYRRFSLTSVHDANYHSKDRPNQWPVMLVTSSEVVLAIPALGSVLSGS